MRLNRSVWRIGGCIVSHFLHVCSQNLFYQIRQLIKYETVRTNYYYGMYFAVITLHINGIYMVPLNLWHVWHCRVSWNYSQATFFEQIIYTRHQVCFFILSATTASEFFKPLSIQEGVKVHKSSRYFRLI
jgi:hypothetical protein